VMRLLAGDFNEIAEECLIVFAEVHARTKRMHRVGVK
jgi:hypothetical protein